MAQPTNLTDRYDINNVVAEDVFKRITRTSPEKTPVVTLFGDDTSDQTYHEWLRDSLRAPNKDNAAVDGDDATPKAKTPPVRVANYCQIFEDTIAVSGRAETVKKLGGIKSAMAHFKAKTFIELRRDLEAAVVSKNAAVAGSGSTAMKMGGLGVQIFTNALHGGSGATAAHTSGAPTTAVTAGTNRAFSETLFKQGIQAAYTKSGTAPPVAVMSPYHKTVFSDFDGIAAIRVDVVEGRQARIVGGADVYQSDFGKITIVPNDVMEGSDMVFGLNPEYGDIVYLRRYKAEPLGKTGDSTKEQIILDATMRLTSENAHFKIDNLTPSAP